MDSKIFFSYAYFIGIVQGRKVWRPLTLLNSNIWKVLKWKYGYIYLRFSIFLFQGHQLMYKCWILKTKWINCKENTVCFYMFVSKQPIGNPWFRQELLSSSIKIDSCHMAKKHLVSWRSHISEIFLYVSLPLFFPSSAGSIDLSQAY